MNEVNHDASNDGPLVTTARCDEYALDAVTSAVRTCLEPLGGMAAFVKPGMKVLLKPNLVMGFAPAKAANTHPVVVEAVGRLVVDCGGELLVGDSPGMGSAAKVAKACGIAEVVERLGGRVIEFTIDPGGKKEQAVLGDMELAQELNQVDVVINLPKFKSHGMTALTLAIKNCFGCVVGTRKLQWHFRAGHNADLFCRMLVHVFRASRVTLNLVDAVVGMEGMGPTAGRPKEMGFLAASVSGEALDTYCARAIGVDPLQMPTIRAAAQEDGGTPDWLRPQVVGEAADLQVDNFELPPARTHYHMGPLSWCGVLRRWLTAKPVVKPDVCIGCGVCKRLCPAQVIEMKDKLPVIDDVACIRCYCCHELCPEHAMDLQTGWLGRLIGFFKKKNRA